MCCARKHHCERCAAAEAAEQFLVALESAGVAVVSRRSSDFVKSITVLAECHVIQVARAAQPIRHGGASLETYFPPCQALLLAYLCTASMFRKQTHFLLH